MANDPCPASGKLENPIRKTPGSDVADQRQITPGTASSQRLISANVPPPDADPTPQWVQRQIDKYRKYNEAQQAKQEAPKVVPDKPELSPEEKRAEQIAAFRATVDYSEVDKLAQEHREKNAAMKKKYEDERNAILAEGEKKKAEALAEQAKLNSMTSEERIAYQRHNRQTDPTPEHTKQFNELKKEILDMNHQLWKKYPDLLDYDNSTFFSKEEQRQIIAEQAAQPGGRGAKSTEASISTGTGGRSLKTGLGAAGVTIYNGKLHPYTAEQMKSMNEENKAYSEQWRKQVENTWVTAPPEYNPPWGDELMDPSRLHISKASEPSMVSFLKDKYKMEQHWLLVGGSKEYPERYDNIKLSREEYKELSTLLKQQEKIGLDLLEKQMQRRIEKEEKSWENEKVKIAADVEKHINELDNKIWREAPGKAFGNIWRGVKKFFTG